MCSTLSSCRLYSWMRLICSRRCVRVDRLRRSWPAASRRSAPWPSRLASRKRSRNAASSASGRSSRELRQVGDPAVADRIGDRARRARGFASSSQRRGVTPLVLLLNRSGNISAKSRHRARAQQLGVDRGDAVGAVRADDRQVGHADLALRALPRSGSCAARVRRRRGSAPHVVEEAAVDLVDDLQLPRQQQLERARTGHFSSASGSSVWLV